MRLAMTDIYRMRGFLGLTSCTSCAFFFFSSRRRHTRCSRDWSSDVCSSDLCEYASMFAAYGIKVTLFDIRNDLLRFVDQEIVQALIYHMRTNGVTMRLGEQLDKVATDEQGRVVTTFKSGKTIVTDVLLYAMGRIANTDMLNLAAPGMTPDKTGQLKVNEHYQTEVPHIYAAGDVIGFPALASTSMEQGRLACCHAFNVAQSALPKVLPYGIYTIPEISTVGKSEEELTKEG